MHITSQLSLSPYYFVKVFRICTVTEDKGRTNAHSLKRIWQRQLSW